ncbi:MAG: NAD(P)-dependent glycerol-3-phosphate dehydrogenase [Paucimonas sp.]|jgi:glycerol-3-phosphate dehydrogenase (NAD(P)+)|nr:NAD(P)-dependent glycerol-3-phosphate dehydrogenase [Paucimonas sp.]
MSAAQPADIVILGAGAWGTALAVALAGRHRVTLWGRDAEAMRRAQTNRENALHLPGIPFPDGLTAVTNLGEALSRLPSASDQSLLIAATPVSGLRPLARQLRNKPIPHLVWLCKGFEESTRTLPHRIVADELGTSLPAGVLSGPSFAQEVAQGLPCALTIASQEETLCRRVVDVVHGRSIRVYSTDDIIGVEVGGAVKNVMAIATGITDGMGLGMNARAALITRGLAEIARLGTALGGRAETFTGLTGMGDLILTCTGDLSRNRRVGLGLAHGRPLAEVVKEIGHVAEGVRCAREVSLLAAEKGIEMPIAAAVAAVLFDGIAPQEWVSRLLSRDPRRE